MKWGYQNHAITDIKISKKCFIFTQKCDTQISGRVVIAKDDALQKRGKKTLRQERKKSVVKCYVISSHVYGSECWIR